MDSLLAMGGQLTADDENVMAISLDGWTDIIVIKPAIL